jgi:hypothetical protein
VQVNGTGRSARVPVALLAVAVLAVLALAGAAARSGSYAPELPPAPTRSAAPTPAPAPPAESAPTSSAAPTPSAPPEPVNPVTGRIVLVLVLLFAAAGLVVLVVLAVRHRPRLQRRPPDAAVLPSAGDPAASALPDAVDRALAAVEQPDAREAVVQAWLLLGAAAAEAGTPSGPAETATEYAERLARAHTLPPTSVHRLAALYREARFSGHPVRDDQRDEARAQLTALRAALSSARAGSRP